jgi:hypothetical protein
MKKRRINLGKGSDGKELVGWEYELPCDVSVRRFDDGNVAWFYSPRVNGVMWFQVAVHFTPKGRYKWTNRDEYRVNISFYQGKNGTDRTEFSGWGKTRREAFTRLREDMNMARRALRKFPTRKLLTKDKEQIDF